MKAKSTLVPFPMDVRTVTAHIVHRVLEILCPFASQVSFLLLLSCPHHEENAGTSVSVYGIFSWLNLGVMSATYNLDGKTLPKSYSVTTSSPQFINNDGEATNFALFSSDTLPAGDHTLTIAITKCENQSFTLDYITYIPSFSTLSSMPNLSPVASGSSTSIPQIYSITTTGESTTFTGVTDSPKASNRERSSPPLGAILGGVLGGLLLFALLAICCLWRQKRGDRHRAVEEARGFNGE